MPYRREVTPNRGSSGLCLSRSQAFLSTSGVSPAPCSPHLVNRKDATRPSLPHRDWGAWEGRFYFEGTSKVEAMYKDATNALIRWVTEREAVRIRRESGDPAPWTSDPIIQRYRFCNVRREDDRVTRWISKNLRVPYDTAATRQYLPIILSIGRWFNLPSTLQSLIVEGFLPSKDTVWIPDFREMHKFVASLPAPIFNGAYIIPNAGVKMDKIKFVFSKALSQVWSNRATIYQASQLPENQMKMVHGHFNSMFAWGPFMSYQVVVDLRHTGVLDHATDTKTFISCGPGTRRGFDRLFGIGNRLPLADKVAEVQDCIANYAGMELEASDIANCMCELDKYMRGGSKSVYRYPDERKAARTSAHVSLTDKRGPATRTRGRPRKRGKLQ